ncbi:MAG: hypothetical protein HY567_00780 [Candidatus Kerfeldbacteria bacterium]|nr:hypothetical protein [Candidatus Kerfeldbacteria bacterium]
MFVVALVLAALTGGATCVSADAIAFYFGQQLAGTGSAAEATINRGAIAFVPWLALDGSKFETLVMARYADSTATVAFGPLLGSNNNPKSGATPYFGAEARGKVQLWHSRFIFRLVERHTKEALLARFANIGLEAGPPQLLVRLSYQPIQRNRVVTHRLALKAVTSYRNAKVGVEIRQNFDGSNRKGALAEVVIPLKR